jgi:hypothetical protein
LLATSVKTMKPKNFECKYNNDLSLHYSKPNFYQQHRGAQQFLQNTSHEMKENNNENTE